ncbi:hypothetical protein PSA01_51870 [Pseudonocardia saturnea]|uniref:Uncharacterized protein n=1 Tax=Pseudonocardia saturnea TaxID=33909 RepID=A0ABQ0S5F9_9PSEU|nr:hypothetical protein Pdca_69570 [Pseudonocardia autotrophica]GEC28158.1 hypothetical protein PSA01_51870 [Pseudonocardia saturnea]
MVGQLCESTRLAQPQPHREGRVRAGVGPGGEEFARRLLAEIDDDITLLRPAEAASDYLSRHPPNSTVR